LQVINFDKGSKRKLQTIRWKRIEIVSAVSLSIFLMAACVLVALWYASHDRDESQTPSLEIRR
jgi:Co/Zn/Cd efflux system component